MKELTIDPMFRDALPRLTETEFKQLEENILADGEIREPLILWHNTIIDGHNRYEIAKKHNIPFKTVQRNFADQWDAIDWMCRNQLGKRNMTEAQKTYTLGKLYEARKNTQGGDRGNQYTKAASGENAHLPKQRNITRETIAKEQSISPDKVKRAYEFSRAVDIGEEIAPGFREAVISGKTAATKTAISSMNRMTDDERKEAAESIMRGEYVAEKKPTPKIKEVGTSEYDAEDFRMEIAQFPTSLQKSIQMTLTMHGDMLTRDECKKDFAAMLDSVIAVAEKFKEELKNG